MYQRRALARFYTQVPVHNLRDNAQPAGGRVVAENHSLKPAHREHVAAHVQLRAAGERGEIRKQVFQQRQENRQQHAGVYGVEGKAHAEEQEAQDYQHRVYYERNHRDGHVNKAVYDYRRAGHAVYGGMAGHEEKVHNRRHERHDHSYYGDFPGLSQKHRFPFPAFHILSPKYVKIFH